MSKKELTKANVYCSSKSNRFSVHIKQKNGRNTWLDTYLGMDFFTASDLETNRTNNYAETYHGRQKEHFTQKHPPLELFIFENRRLLNHQEFYAKRVTRGLIAPPEK
jgi:hypothetical protein